MAEWSEFLKKFAAAIYAAEWPGKQGVSEAQLLAGEKRLRVTLPPSYRAFLLASNGWSQASVAVPVLRSIDKLRWFWKEHRDWVDAYTYPTGGIEARPIAEEDYFDYANGYSYNFEGNHLEHTLCLSEKGDSAVLLLNPMVVWPDGEWEAWFFADWLPGATRYRSFAEWMRHELAGLLDETFEHAKVPGELPKVYIDAPGKAMRRIRSREEIHVLETEIERLGSTMPRARMRAAQLLSHLGGKEAVDALLSTLRMDSDADVRCEAAEALGKLGAAEAVGALITATNYPGVTSTAIHALGGFQDEQSAQFLLRVLEVGGIHATCAVNPLARRGDARAVSHLVRFLTSKKEADVHIGNIAGNLIAQFGEDGYDALELLMTHQDVEIRSRAIRGVVDLASCSKAKPLRIESRALLQKSLETETDPELRKHLENAIEMPSKKNAT